jgi:hypothetical protein
LHGKRIRRAARLTFLKNDGLPQPIVRHSLAQSAGSDFRLPAIAGTTACYASGFFDVMTQIIVTKSLACRWARAESTCILCVFDPVFVDKAPFRFHWMHWIILSVREMEGGGERKAESEKPERAFVNQVSSEPGRRQPSGDSQPETRLPHREPETLNLKPEPPSSTSHQSPAT